MELRGIENYGYVCGMMKTFNDQREKQAIRLVLKHLRDKGYMSSFKALEKEAKIHLEDNQITELYQSLVEEGSFERSEEIMSKFIECNYYLIISTFSIRPFSVQFFSDEMRHFDWLLFKYLTTF